MYMSIWDRNKSQPTNQTPVGGRLPAHNVNEQTAVKAALCDFNESSPTTKLGTGESGIQTNKQTNEAK